MKDYDGIILAIFIITVAAGLFYGIKMFAAKAFSTPPPENKNTSSHYYAEQHKNARETKTKAKDLQRQQRQKIRDLQRRSVN